LDPDAVCKGRCVFDRIIATDDRFSDLRCERHKAAREAGLEDSVNARRVLDLDRRPFGLAAFGYVNIAPMPDPHPTLVSDELDAVDIFRPFDHRDGNMPGSVVSYLTIIKAEQHVHLIVGLNFSHTIFERSFFNVRLELGVDGCYVRF